MTKQPTYHRDDLARDFFNNASSGFVITTGEGEILDANSTLLKWLGYTRDELVGEKRFWDLLAVGGKIYYNTHHRPALALQEEVQEIAYDLMHTDGTRIPVLVNSRYHQSEQDERRLILFVISSYVDRSKYERELRIAKDKADRANRSKAAFISNVSHEIRTPIHAIRSAADFLMRQEPRYDQREWLRVLMDNAHSLTQLVNDVLDFHKLEEGRVTLVHQPFNLKELLSGIVENFRMQQLNTQVKLIEEVDASLPEWFMGDCLKVRQVITNLLSNALKFTKKGEVRLKLDGKGGAQQGYVLSFRISDTGIGLSKRDIDKVFKPYVQANANIERDFGGTGLGLSICYNILRAFDSVLEVESTVGEGTTFFFQLKLPEAKPEEQPTVTTAAEIRDYEKLSPFRVLAVDDNLSNILIISRYLEMWGIEYVTATDGLTAFQLIKDQHFDLVLMDLRMPGMSGYESATKVRALPELRFRELPIIAVSATTSPALSIKMKRAGFNQLIIKPFQPDELYDTLKKYFFLKTTHATGEQSEHIDFSTLAEMYGQDFEDLSSFLDAVVADIGIAVNDLETAPATTPRLLSDTRHKLKSMTALLRLETLQTLLAVAITAVREEGESAGKAPAQSVIEELKAIVERIKAYQRTLLERP